jgi:nicotinamidase-related amidase
MCALISDASITALLVIDPYNDFISEGGKAWDRVRTTAEVNDCVPHMAEVMAAARTAGVRVAYALHRRYRPGDYETWDYMAPVQERAWRRRTFAYGTWGGEVREGFEPQPGDIVAQEHWCSSGFANTDLDQQLKLHGIRHLVVIGLLANTCVEATVRFAAELGYKATVVTDATASLTAEEMHAALEVNLPSYATMTTTDQVLAALAVPAGEVAAGR